MSGPADDRGRLPLVPVIEVIARARRTIITLGFAAALGAAGVGLIWPITYEADLTILPPQEASPLGAMGGGLEASLTMLQVGFQSLRSVDLYADMLRSRSVFRYAAKKLDLLSVFGLARMDTLRAWHHAFNRMRNDVTVETANNGMITLTARAHTGFFPGKEAKAAARQRAADLANTLAAGLEEVNRSKNTSQARQARIYLEAQHQETDARLARAGVELAEFQTRHLAVNLDEQVRVGIETAGKLEAEALSREVALGVALRSMQPGNPEVRRLESEIAEIRSQLGNLRSGTGLGGTDSASLGFEALPELARQYALLLREVKVQEALYEMLTAQLYQARIKETEQVPVVQVLDEARPPIGKKSPELRKLVVLSGILGGVLGIFLAFAAEWWRRYPFGPEDLRALRALTRR